MITKILIIGLLSAFLSGGLFSLRNQQGNITGFSPQSSPLPTVQHAVFYNGEMLPGIELPEVLITGKRNPSSLVRAILVDGEAFPHYELESVTVRPSV